MRPVGSSLAGFCTLCSHMHRLPTLVPKTCAHQRVHLGLGQALQTVCTLGDSGAPRWTQPRAVCTRAFESKARADRVQGARREAKTHCY